MEKLNQVLLIWAIVYVLITSLLYGMGSWIADLPVYGRTLLLSTVMVFAMNYVVIPTLQKFKKH